MRLILYLMVLSSFLAADVFSVNIKVMELSVFRATLLVVTVFTLLKYLKSNRKISLKLKSNQSKIMAFYLFWFLSSLISIAWVKDYHSWLRAVFFIGSGFVCIWVLSVYLKKQKDFKAVFNIAQFMLIFHNMIGWSELLTGNYRFADLSRMDRHNQFAYNPTARFPISMFTNPNNYATLLVVGVFISYIVFLNSESKLGKTISMSTIISSVVLIIRSKSRANMLGLIIGIAILIYIRYFKKVNIITIVSIFMAPVLLLVGLRYADVIYMAISEKIYFSFSTSGSDITRLNLIKNGLYFLKRTVGFGVGVGNIEYWMSTENIHYVGNIQNIHNWWAEILVGSGIFVFIGYITMYFKKAKTLYYSYLNSDNEFIKNTSSGLFAIMAAFTVSSVSSSSNMSTEWLWLFWGVVIAYIGYVERQKNKVLVHLEE